LLTTSSAAGLQGVSVQQVAAAVHGQLAAADQLRRQQVAADQAIRFARFVQMRRFVRQQREAEEAVLRAGNEGGGGRPTRLTRPGTGRSAVRVAADGWDEDRPRITVLGYGRS
jgi:hypothetical protein